MLKKTTLAAAIAAAIVLAFLWVARNEPGPSTPVGQATPSERNHRRGGSEDPSWLEQVDMMTMPGLLLALDADERARVVEVMRSGEGEESLSEYQKAYLSYRRELEQELDDALFENYPSPELAELLGKAPGEAKP